MSTSVGAPPLVPAGQSRLQLWIQAVRYRSFTASAIPIVAGSLLALLTHEFKPVVFVLMLLAAVACHAGANMANDYFDFKKGIDNAESIGANKLILQGRLSADEMKRGMIVAFAIATVLGIAVVLLTHWIILALALASIAAAYFYTGGPKPLGYIALGELVAFIFMGPVMVGGAYLAMTGTVSGPVLVVSLAIGCLVAAIMHANNIRDIDTDIKAGKTTVASLSGRALANQEYLVLIGGAFLAVLVLVAFDHYYWPVLATLLAIPPGLRLANRARTAAGAAELNGLLRKTAGLHLRFGLLLILGLLLRALLDQR